MVSMLGRARRRRRRRGPVLVPEGCVAVEITEVAPNNGCVAAAEWTPPSGAEGAAITGVRAEALDLLRAC